MDLGYMMVYVYSFQANLLDGLPSLQHIPISDSAPAPATRVLFTTAPASRINAFDRPGNQLLIDEGPEPQRRPSPTRRDGTEKRKHRETRGPIKRTETVQL